MFYLFLVGHKKFPHCLKMKMVFIPFLFFKRIRKEHEMNSFDFIFNLLFNHYGDINEIDYVRNKTNDRYLLLLKC
jgi:hypothetical protein